MVTNITHSEAKGLETFMLVKHSCSSSLKSEQQHKLAEQQIWFVIIHN